MLTRVNKNRELGLLVNISSKDVFLRRSTDFHIKSRVFKVVFTIYYNVTEVNPNPLIRPEEHTVFEFDMTGYIIGDRCTSTTLKLINFI